VDPNKIDIIRSVPTPQKKRDVRIFLVYLDTIGGLSMTLEKWPNHCLYFWPRT